MDLRLFLFHISDHLNLFFYHLNSGLAPADFLPYLVKGKAEGGNHKHGHRPAYQLINHHTPAISSMNARATFSAYSGLNKHTAASTTAATAIRRFLYFFNRAITPTFPRDKRQTATRPSSSPVCPKCKVSQAARPASKKRPLPTRRASARRIRQTTPSGKSKSAQINKSHKSRKAEDIGTDKFYCL